MMKYAREDTHYLLYVYDCLRKELVEEGTKQNSKNPYSLLKLAIHKSNGICLKTYEKHIVKDFNYFMILQRNETHNTLSQQSVLKAMLKYRDYVARVEDESTHYIMPNHVLFTVAKNLPVTRSEFRDCCRSNFTSMLMKY
jgi:exosome complex exonuclease RRP6